MVITRGVLFNAREPLVFFCSSTKSPLYISCQQHTIPAHPRNIHIQTQQKSEGKYDVCPGFRPEPGGAPPGLLPTDKAGSLEVAEEVHHPDIIDILVHGQPSFQVEAAPKWAGSGLRFLSSEILDFQKQSFRTCIRHYFPRCQGGSRRTALARTTGISPLRGSLRAAPIAWSRYHPGLWLDRSIIVRLLTRVGLGKPAAMRNSLPQAALWTDGHRSAPS